MVDPQVSARTALSAAWMVSEVLPEGISWRQVTKTSAARAEAAKAGRAKSVERMMDEEQGRCLSEERV